MSYGPNLKQFRRYSADYVDRILKGRTQATCRSSSRQNSNLSST